MSDILLSKEKTTKENRIWVRISSACNNKCIFCLDENAQDGTLVDEIIVKNQIKEGFKIGHYNRIIISGGEASINPKFPKYIAYAKEIGYERVQTVTNGNMFASQNFCNKVFSSGLQEVTFSFHGHTSRLHNFLVDTPGAFIKSLTGLLYIKKFFPHIIVNIDIVVNKVNVKFLPDIVKFFMKIGVYEYDILHIIPFGRGFDKYKKILFYDIKDYIEPLHKTWELSRVPGMCIWTNRFPAEAFDGYEDLIQDPRKIRSEVGGEGYQMYSNFISSKGKIKPSCYGESCNHCFINQYCHDFLRHRERKFSQDDVYTLDGTKGDMSNYKYISLRSELFVSEIYKKYGTTAVDLKKYIRNLQLSDQQSLLNVPYCIRKDNNNNLYEYYPDVKKNEDMIEEYTDQYILNFYRKKGIKCSSCKYRNTCEGININFIRAYGFKLLEPIK